MLRLSALAALSALLIGCGQDRLRPALPPGVRVDTYTQQGASVIDVLWVVDNSGSMAPRQENLARNFQGFIDTFTKSKIDYRLAVTTTDIFREQGRFVGSPKVITPDSGNVLNLFATNVRVGITGSPYEAGLEAARMALERQAATNVQTLDACKRNCPTNKPTCPAECEAAPFEFLRTNAYLYLAFVTDEDDESSLDVRYYYRSFETTKGVGNDGMVTTSAIMGDTPTNSCGATPGARYKALSDLTGGEVGSICDPNFSVALKKMANNAIGLKRTFALQAKPNIQTIEVHFKYPCDVAEDFTRPCSSVNRDACAGAAADALELVCTPVQGGPDGWEYRQEPNVIYFAGDSVPGLSAEIDLQYYEEGKGP